LLFFFGLSFKSLAAKVSFEVRELAEKQKELKTCHQCGLEAIDDCVTENKHIPFDENLAPCKFCTRNPTPPKSTVVADFYDEMWTLDTDKTPIIEDADDPHERLLLKMLHDLTEGGGKQWRKLEVLSLSPK
jgi:hypothetical protein